MTKVQLQFHIAHPPDETLMGRIAAAHSLYGIYHLQIAPSLDALNVEYDASRLTAEDLEAALRRTGIPIERER